MNSKTLMMAVVIGGLGLLSLVIAAMMGFGQIADKKPLVRVSVAVADHHKVKEVSLSVFPLSGENRTLRVAYTTSVLKTRDDQRAEMEELAKFAWEQTDKMEMEKLSLAERPLHRPIRKVDVRRTWRSERGCFKRSDLATHEWTAPVKPPIKR
jgi:hypothetical protein